MKKKSKEYIVAFGGKNRDGALSSVERLDMSTNEWSYVHALPSSYYAHAGVVVKPKLPVGDQHCDHEITYISGGYTNGNFTADMHAYELATDRWTTLRPMHAARGWHSMCVVDENLYVFGGCYLVSPGIGTTSI